MLTRSLLLAAAVTLPGCASVTTAGGERLTLTSPEFRAYVERVFRDQNRLADELAFALEDSAQGTRLGEAENDLLEACAGVNELATARRDGRRLELKARVRAARSVAGCERALRAAQEVLETEAGRAARG